MELGMMFGLGFALGIVAFAELSGLSLKSPFGIEKAGKKD